MEPYSNIVNNRGNRIDLPAAGRFQCEIPCFYVPGWFKLISVALSVWPLILLIRITSDK
jgi:hypothetical protein